MFGRVTLKYNVLHAKKLNMASDVVIYIVNTRNPSICMWLSVSLYSIFSINHWANFLHIFAEVVIYIGE